jgi:arylsulfatase A-like enzyme
VHTYRAHEPYEVTAETRAELGERLGLGPTWDDLVKVIQAEVVARTQAGDPNDARLLSDGDLHRILIELGLLDPASPHSGPFLASIRALYRAGSRDLDRAFGAFLDDVDASARDAWVVFTSDHGEAFGEHESIFHGYGVWEENLRVPLLIRGPGLAPRTLSHPVSLVDLPHTLAEIAGIAPDPRWTGRSLLSLDVDRPIFSFDCAQRGDPHGAVIDADLKVVFEPTAEGVRAGRVTGAFDLAADPAELDDLGAAPRATGVLERLAKDALERMHPLAAPGRADAPLSQMEKLGYAGFGGK